MSYKKTILQLQRMLIEASAEVELKQVKGSALETGCEAVDIVIQNEDEFLQENPPCPSTFDLIGGIISQEFEDDGSGNYWDGYPSDKKPGRVVIGIDRFNTAYDRRAYVRVEEQGPEFLAQFDEGEKMQTSFKEFLNEARKANVNYQEERTKGVVTKVIAQLEGHDAGRLTKLAREYHKLNKALDKIEKAKAERNKQLKDLIGDTFDPELDKFYTRVMASATFTATLAKETHPDDVALKVEIAYEKLVDGLLKLISDELQPAAQELVEACTRKWKPDPRSPNLSVKPLDEGLGALAVSMVAGWWRKIKETVSKHLARFDKGLPKLEAQLEAYRALPKSSLGVEGAKADRKHKAVTTNESAGRFKTFVLEAPKGKKPLSPLEQLKALPQPIGINGGAYTYWVDVTKSPLKFTASDGTVVDEAKTLEDIKRWMEEWAADLWQEFLDGDEALELLQDERIIRVKKPNSRMDQEDHESQMHESAGKFKAKAVAKASFRKYESFELWNDTNGADYDESEIDGKRVGVLYDNEHVIGLWYKKAKVGSISNDFAVKFPKVATDIVAYSELDPYWPYGN